MMISGTSPKMHCAAQRLQLSALLILRSCLGLPICLKVNCLHTYEMGISVLVPTLFMLMIYKTLSVKAAELVVSPYHKTPTCPRFRDVSPKLFVATARKFHHFLCLVLNLGKGKY